MKTGHNYAHSAFGRNGGRGIKARLLQDELLDEIFGKELNPRFVFDDGERAATWDATTVGDDQYWRLRL
jgi:hypothetical protein